MLRSVHQQSKTEELVFVHPAKADRLVRPGCCWRLRRAVDGTRRASRLWTDTVKFVLRWAGCFILRAISLVFWHLVDKCMLTVWSDDFGFASVPEALQRLSLESSENETKELGIIGLCDRTLGSSR